MNRFVLKNTFIKVYIYHLLINVFIKIRGQSNALVTLRHALFPDPEVCGHIPCQLSQVTIVLMRSCSFNFLKIRFQDARLSAIKGQPFLDLMKEFSEYDKGCEAGLHYEESKHHKNRLVKGLLQGHLFTTYGCVLENLYSPKYI